MAIDVERLDPPSGTGDQIPSSGCTEKGMVDPILIELDAARFSMSSLALAADRISGLAKCDIEKIGDRYKCRLMPIEATASVLDIRARFIELANEEQLLLRHRHPVLGLSFPFPYPF